MTTTGQPPHPENDVSFRPVHLMGREARTPSRTELMDRRSATRGVATADQRTGQTPARMADYQFIKG